MFTMDLKSMLALLLLAAAALGPGCGADEAASETADVVAQEDAYPDSETGFDVPWDGDPGADSSGQWDWDSAGDLAGGPDAVFDAGADANPDLDADPVAPCYPYEIIDLGTLPGGELANAIGINNAGAVVGASEGDDNGAFYWVPDTGTMHPMSTWPVAGLFVGGKAEAINEGGLAVGGALAPLTGAGIGAQAFYWTEATGMVHVDPSTEMYSWAYGVNASGLVVGASSKGAFVWQHGTEDPFQIVTMPGVTGNAGGEFLDVNDAGVAVGALSVAVPDVTYQMRPFTWSEADGPTELVPLAPVEDYDGIWVGQARGINDAGLVVGEVLNPGEFVHSVLWTAPDEIHDLGVLDNPMELDSGQVEEINESGWIVGWDSSLVFSGIWTRGWILRWGVDDEKIALEDLVPPEQLDEWLITAPLDINDDGDIVGIGIHDGTPGSAFLMRLVDDCDWSDAGAAPSPQPEPDLGGPGIEYCAAESFELVVIEKLPYGADAWATGINSWGDVAGTNAMKSGTFEAFLWDGDVLVDLEESSTSELGRSQAVAISDDGLIVGTAVEPMVEPGAWSQVFVWTHADGLRRLFTNPTAPTEAGDVNNLGQIVGDYDNVAFIAELGADVEVTMIGVPEGYYASEAWGINDLGQVVGGAWFDPGATVIARPYVWSEAHGFTILPNQPADDPGPEPLWSRALDINDQGLVVGYLDGNGYGGSGQPVYWEDGALVELELLIGTVGAATAVSGQDEIVGWDGEPAYLDLRVGWLWRDGVKTDLNELIADPGDLVFFEAHDVNEGGQIVGVAGDPTTQTLYAARLDPICD